MRKQRLIFVLFAAAILFSMVREWNAAATCARTLLDPSLGAQTKTLTAYPDPPLIVVPPHQHNLHISLAQQPRKLFSPLDQQNAVVGTQIIESKRLQFSLRIDAVEIDVVEIGMRSAIFVHQGEGRTGRLPQLLLRMQPRCP